VAEGQFAFVPDPEAIMAGITRRSPAYHADVTVEVYNGSGKLGVGEAVLERLASLDVNLPAPLNADSFGYKQTQILAGPDTLPMARDIRAILGWTAAICPRTRSASSSATTSSPHNPARRTNRSSPSRTHDFFRAPRPRHRRRGC